ncbi:MAG: flagellin, partial [Candidatus Omnitrophica bacterium]|nr:flagellin [Candidatus Omnitrophota bacterium]
MALTRINNNISAINANRNLRTTSNDLSKSLERLSSGLRINRASDDAAGLTISENLRAQINGLNRAVDNASDAINLVNTAEGALIETTSRLQRIRVLAIQAANSGTNDSVALQAIQDEIETSIQEITRIADTTQFATRRLLNGEHQNTASVTGGTGLG